MGPTTAEELIGLAASQLGVEVRNENGDTRTLPWATVSVDARINLLEEVRNARSGLETLWVAYYAKLCGSAAADQYFDYVTVIDDGAEMRKLVSELRGAD